MAAVHFGIQLASNSEMDAFQTQLMTLHHLEQMADPRPKLQGNQTPVLLLRGQCNNQPWGVVPDYLGLIPNACLEIVPGAGHAIATERPAEYARRVGSI